MRPTLKSIVQLVVVLGLLAAISVLADLRHVTGDQAYGVLMVVAGATAVAGGIALTVSLSGADLLPHYVLVAAAIGMTVALAVVNVFTNAQIVGVFAVILGSGAAGAGSVVGTNRLTRIQQQPSVLLPGWWRSGPQAPNANTGSVQVVDEPPDAADPAPPAGPIPGV